MKNNCYCDSSKPYVDCCQPLIEGEADAETPEALMRSRYTAFCLKNLEYVQETTDPQTRYKMDQASTKAWMDNSEFLKLEVLSASSEGNKGTVEFKATFKMEGQEPEVHHEYSKFRRQGGIWYFRDGKNAAPPPTE